MRDVKGSHRLRSARNSVLLGEQEPARIPTNDIRAVRDPAALVRIPETPMTRPSKSSYNPSSHNPSSLSPLEAEILGAVSIKEPWALVETFAKWVREHPRDVNRAMDHVAARLASFGVPVTMHEPSLYLSLPGKARVEAGGKSFRAKPPAYRADA